MELFLIAHKVRGEATFDVATRMSCPICEDFEGTNHGCPECDNEGFWWIIPTSGHRAYPYWSKPLDDLAWDLPKMEMAYNEFEYKSIDDVPKMPQATPDHYRHGPAPKVDIKSLFRGEPKPHIPRLL